MPKQKLFTKELQNQAKKFPLYSQDSKGDEAVVWAKFFHPASRYTFFVTEMDIQRLESFGNKQYVEGTAFGYVLSPLGQDCDEWGYVDLQELNELNVRGLSMERDMWFSSLTVGKLKEKSYRV